MKTNFLLVLYVFFLLISCKSEKKNLPYYGDGELDGDTMETSASTSSDYYLDDDEVVVPFEEQGGLKFIDVTVNGQFTVKMILDSGCSGTLISIAEAKYLYDKGCFTQDDIIGTTQSLIADGSIVENMVINLRELVIGDKISCSNVTATVSANAQAPLLLGNEVLNRVTSYSVDNQNKVIKFKLK